MAALSYDPATGIFKRICTGKAVGNVRKSGYMTISVLGIAYLSHRLAWLYVHGVWPPATVDHTNRNPSDNRIVNLRLASKGQNAVNSVKTWSASGIKGVYRQSNTTKWKVRFADKHVGYFYSKKDAAEAYAKAAIEKYGDFAKVMCRPAQPAVLPPRT